MSENPIPRGRGHFQSRIPRYVGNLNRRSSENQRVSSERQTSRARGSPERSSSTHSSGSVQRRGSQRVPGHMCSSNWQNPAIQSRSSSQDQGIKTGGSSERSSSTETVKGHHPNAGIAEGEEFKSGQVEQQRGPVPSGHRESRSTPVVSSQPTGGAPGSPIRSGADTTHPSAHLHVHAPEFIPNNPLTQVIALPPPPRTAIFPALFNTHLPGHADRVDQLRREYPRDLDQELDEDDAIWDDINHDINRARESNQEQTIIEVQVADLDRKLRQEFAERRRKLLTFPFFFSYLTSCSPRMHG